MTGQSEMFEQDNDDRDSESGFSEASDVEAIDKGEDGSASEASDYEEHDAMETSSDEADNVDEQDDELAAFDAKLAQALGTRPGHDDLREGDSSSSDEDMNDEQMEALDEHLEKIFRERKKLKSKKTEKKDAKEMIINFKSRVLELLEIYVKQQHANIIALDLLLPILTLIRTTTSRVVSSKACNLLREYSKLCKGDGLSKITSVEEMATLLQQIHTEAGRDASNAHASACSQASLLVVRVIVAHDKKSFRRVLEVYGDTQEKFFFDTDCKVKTAFFTDWLNWCTSARRRES